MESLLRQRLRAWARVLGTIALTAAILFFVIVAVGMVGIFTLAIPWDTVVSTDELDGQDRHDFIERTLSKYEFLEPVSRRRGVRITDVTPRTFTGWFGHYFVAYTVEEARVDREVRMWRNRADFVGDSVPEAVESVFEPTPDWWPDDSKNLTGVARLDAPQYRRMQVHGVSIWCDESRGEFYLFFEWGH